MSADKMRRKASGSTEQSVVAAKEIATLGLLEHCLYGKNVVRAIDMQNIRKQRITGEETLTGRNNNGISSLSEACDVCLGQKEKICPRHGPLQSLRYLVNAEDLGSGGNIRATYAVMSFPDEVQLCTSSIPGYIYGVCARRHLPSGTWIGPYEGRRTVDQRDGASEIQDYFWEIYTDGNFSHFIDGSDENASSWMRFIRCARNKKEQNMLAYQCGQNIYYRSFCDIAVGEELLVWYSDGYQKHLEIPFSLKETDQAKIEELAETFNEKCPTISLAVPASQTVQHAGSLHEQSLLLPAESILSQNCDTTRPNKASLFQTLSPRSPEAVKPTVQQTLANQIKKRLEKENSSQSQELSKTEKTAKTCFNELAIVKSSDQFKTNDVEDQTLDAEGSKSVVLNDLSLPFKCRQCMKVFTQRIQLQMHVCPQQPYKPFQCGHCSLSFAQPSELRNHVVVHSSERPFKCGFCGRSFAGATTLNNHVRTHTGERPFVCKSCGKTFAIATQLARHTRILGECPGHVSSTLESKYSNENFAGND